MTKSFNITRQETEDLLSAVGVWEREINKKENPETVIALEKLRKRLWIHINKFGKDKFDR